MTYFSTVYGPGGFRYKFTEDDVLWASRMILCEAGDLSWKTWEGRAILWTMLNRWIAQRSRGSSGARTYWEYIRTFAQPINPGWLHGGQFDPDPESVDEDEQRRSRCQIMRLDQIPSQVVAIVREFMSGKIPPGQYAKLSDFASPRVRKDPAEDIGPIALVGVMETSNLFYIQKNLTANWKPGTVVIQPKPSIAGVGVLTALGIVGSLLATRWKGLL